MDNRDRVMDVAAEILDVVDCGFVALRSANETSTRRGHIKVRSELTHHSARILLVWREQR